MNAHQFGNELEAEFGSKSREMVRFIKTVALDALSSVVKMSPVASGRFRGNWDTSIGAASSKAFDTATPDASLTRGDVALANFGAFKAVYLSNSLPYALRLENGYSGQAPSGMVAVTVARLDLKYGRVEL